MIFQPLPPLDAFDPRLVFIEPPKERRIWLSERDDTIVALVSPEDYDAIIARGLWFRIPSGYAVKTFKRPGDKSGSGSIYMHRFVAERAFGPPPGYDYVCDHLNGNRLDNRRSNLRWATKSENSRNLFGRAWRQPELGL